MTKTNTKWSEIKSGYKWLVYERSRYLNRQKIFLNFLEFPRIMRKCIYSLRDGKGDYLPFIEIKSKWKYDARWVMSGDRVTQGRCDVITEKKKDVPSLQENHIASPGP